MTTSTQWIEAAKPNARGRTAYPYWSCALVLLVILFFALPRYRLRDLPLERDEGEYAYSGQLILQGIPPYQFGYSMKLPGTYAAYSSILVLFGDTPGDIHLGLLLANAATTFLVFLLGARLFGPVAGIVAAASYAFLSTNKSVLGFAGHATHFVVLFALAGILALLKAIETKRLWLFPLSGLLLGSAFLMKQPGVFFSLFAGAFLLLNECRTHPVDWRRLILRVGTFSLGAVFPFLLTCAIMLRTGVFAKFWFWCFSYAKAYGSILDLEEGARRLVDRGLLVAAPSFLIWGIAAIGLTAFFWNPKVRTHASFVLLFLFFSFLAICPGLYFRPHYFILVLPAVSLLAGVAVTSAIERLPEWCRSPVLRFVPVFLVCSLVGAYVGLCFRIHHFIFLLPAVSLLASIALNYALGRFWDPSLARILRFLPVLLFVLAFAYGVVTEWTFYFRVSPQEAFRMTYGWEAFPEAQVVADYLKSHSSKDDRVAVLGSEPEIYFYSGRRSATGYLYMDPCVENQKYALSLQKELIDEVETAHPAFVVFANGEFSWPPGANPQKVSLLSWANHYIHDHYEPIGIADILGATQGDALTQYRWGADAKNYQPRSPLFLELFQRKD